MAIVDQSERKANLVAREGYCLSNSGYAQAKFIRKVPVDAEWIEIPCIGSHKRLVTSILELDLALRMLVFPASHPNGYLKACLSASSGALISS